jgi:hypothetical protein
MLILERDMMGLEQECLCENKNQHNTIITRCHKENETQGKKGTCSQLTLANCCGVFDIAIEGVAPSVRVLVVAEVAVVDAEAGVVVDVFVFVVGGSLRLRLLHYRGCVVLIYLLESFLFFYKVAVVTDFEQARRPDNE